MGIDIGRHLYPGVTIAGPAQVTGEACEPLVQPCNDGIECAKSCYWEG